MSVTLPVGLMDSLEFKCELYENNPLKTDSDAQDKKQNVPNQRHCVLSTLANE